jgi:hypothetical protein
VVVALVAVARAHPRHLAVGAVQDQVFALAVPAMNTLPPGEDGLSTVALRLEVHRILFLPAHGAQPHRLPIVVEDHRAVLGGILLSGAVLRSGEDVAWGAAARPRGHLD